jgi:uncharacterized protein (TIGR03067 family)
MKRAAFLVLMTGLLAAADAPNPQAGEDRLQGTWYIVSVNRPSSKGGRESLDFKDNRFTLNFDQGTVTSIGEGKLLWQGTYRLDRGANPGTIDITRRSGPFKHGTYQQNGDSLTLCLDIPARPRPTTVAAAKDSQAEVMIFKRLKPGS